MKLVQGKKLWVITTIILAVGYVVSCTKKDQVIITTSPVSSSILVSVKTATAPTIDGVVDAVWSNAPELDITPTVPYPGNGLFTGYNGQQYPATLRSMYDDKYIYFLAQWGDAEKGVYVATWYFNPT